MVMEEYINGVPIIKSGSNFNNVGLIKMYLPSKETEHPCNRMNFECKIYDVPEFETTQVDQELKSYVDGLMEEYAKFDQVIGYNEVDLETRFVKIRSQESNYGNFLADLVRKYYDADISLINAGMVRNDLLVKPGRLTYSKVSNMSDSPMIVKKVKGVHIR